MDVEYVVNRFMRRYKVPGSSLALVKDGMVVYEGLRHKAEGCSHMMLALFQYCGIKNLIFGIFVINIETKMEVKLN